MTAPRSIICIGETMAQCSSAGTPLADAHQLTLGVGGAESNVAAALAQLGHRVEWWSRLGCDPFGDRVLAELAARGVFTGNVVRDPQRPTGLYVKDAVAGAATRVWYYRRGSAASAIGPGDAARIVARGRVLCHLSGITAALSESADAFVAAALGAGVLRSFDVNYRPQVWAARTDLQGAPASEAAQRLAHLARLADIVFVGRDEAQALWGTATAQSIREFLPEPRLLIVKDADIGATGFHGTRSVFVPSLRVHVVEAVGAGDAFAAGVLSGILNGAPLADALALGHQCAAVVLGCHGDMPAPEVR